MSKYAINKEFFPFSHFKPPVNEKLLALAVPHMKVPHSVFHDQQIAVTPHIVKSYDGAKLTCFLMSPRNITGKAPCLIYIHGGGFVFPAAGYHYKNAMHYAAEAECRVMFVEYRLAPQHRHPVFFEDCYAVVCNLYSHAEKLHIDTSRIGIGGDSVGATLAVGVCMMLHDRNHPLRLLFQMLPYPFLDASGKSEAYRKYTDTPMWNSTLGDRIASMTQAAPNNPNYVYYSPTEAKNYEYLPPAYIETAKFDCLHDDGILYAKRLRDARISVTLNETKGTMHGFDIVRSAPTAQAAMQARIHFMRSIFWRQK